MAASSAEDDDELSLSLGKCPHGRFAEFAQVHWMVSSDGELRVQGG